MIFFFFSSASRDGTSVTPSTRVTPVRRRGGFTLIELLVVIAIIALLAAILFPVFARARENARKSSCANNLKQMGVAMAQYTQDFDEYYMPVQSAPPGIGATFVSLLAPYIKNNQVFICPSGSRTVTTTLPSGPNADRYWRVDSPPWLYTAQGSYGVNGNVMISATPKSLAEIPKPAELFLIFDCAWYVGSNSTDQPVFNAMRHLDGGNFCYADGHVKAYTRTQLTATVPVPPPPAPPPRVLSDNFYP